jgi:hypothetical protein
MGKIFVPGCRWYSEERVVCAQFPVERLQIQLHAKEFSHSGAGIFLTECTIPSTNVVLLGLGIDLGSI